MKKIIEPILTALWFEAICSTSEESSVSGSSKIMSEILDIESSVNSFHQTQDFDELEKIYEGIYNFEENIIAYKTSMSLQFINNLGTTHIIQLLTN